MPAHPEECNPSTGVPESTIAARLHFVWFAVIAALWTIPISILQLITHQFQPTAGNFKRTARAWGHVILTLSGFRVRVKDRSRIDSDQPCVFVSNHQTCSIFSH
jgi:1-acyl-sn-glycerol-3-phosphate acyltransferase